MTLIEEALRSAHHELTVLGNLKAFDEEDPQDTFTINPSKTLDLIERAITSIESDLPVTVTTLDAARQE